MNLLINTSTLKVGGGQNVALNFLLALQQYEFNQISFIFLVAKDSAIHNELKKQTAIEFIVFSQNPLLRIMQELIQLPRLIKKKKIDLTYTYFGYAVLSKKNIQVCGVAVSNIFFPEINFWEEYHGVELIKRRIIDKYWKWGIKRAHGLIFENDSMRKRSNQILNIPFEKSIYLMPSNNLIGESTQEDTIIPLKKTIKLLLLCGWQRNKNIMKVPEIAFELKKRNFGFEFIITAPTNNSNDHLEFIKSSKELGVDGYIKLIGSKTKSELPSLYTSIDYVLLLSKLESFSNNILEAWIFKEPLIITDAEWSRAICREAAFYVDRSSASDIADAIIYLNNKPEIVQKLLIEAHSEVKKYPSIVEKAKREIDFLKKIYETASTN